MITPYEVYEFLKVVFKIGVYACLGYFGLGYLLIALFWRD